ncbi:DEKNAAC103780 [Brettanomyces naardenensis]|uniref:DEKNAAC103780 n=1 Tax=Brettanomyces naardenensis TaxID=13370 RepID=A0A448YPF0_BRENA|nr:DEKNAAC103780 [Brettanomyces naardenensis]
MSDDVVESSSETSEYPGNPDTGADNPEVPNLERTSVQSLLRSVSRFTEFSMVTGEAAREEEKDGDGEIVHAHKTAPDDTPKEGFWARSNQNLRLDLLRQWIIIILILATYIFAVFSIYWGSMYRRDSRLVNLKVLVVVENDRAGEITSTILKTIDSPSVKPLAGWTVRNYTSEQQVINLVHTEKYWGSIYVTGSNVSEELIADFQNGSSLNTSTLIRSYYESARDPVGISSYTKPALLQAGEVFRTIWQTQVYPKILANLSSDQLIALKNSSLLATIPEIQYTDGNPVTSPILTAPLQVGLLYLVIISFFQIMWFMKINGTVANMVKPVSYILYRVILIQANCLILSLAYTCLNRAFQIDLQRSWTGGFAVLWMVSYLAMSACAGAGENVVLICTATIPPLAGFWVLFFIILNISATFSPIELCPEVYRFAYAMPIKNAYELMKMVFLNTYRGSLGRYIGVLVAWLVVNSLLFPFCLLFFASRMKKRVEKGGR